MSMEPLRIEWQFATPWAPPHGGVHLDGLLAFARVREAASRAHAGGCDGIEYDDLLADLPLEMYQSANGACWKASKLEVIGFAQQERRYLTAKTPVESMVRDIGRGLVSEKGTTVIDTKRCAFKNAAMFYTLELARGAQAWCVGDADAIAELLQRVEWLGTKGRLGHGALLPYEDGRLFKLERDDGALENWKRRNAPEQFLPDMIPTAGAIRPPYWRANGYCWAPA